MQPIESSATTNQQVPQELKGLKWKTLHSYYKHLASIQNEEAENILLLYVSPEECSPKYACQHYKRMSKRFLD